MSEPYDNLLEDADEVIEQLGEVIERLKTRVDDQHSLILGQRATIKALGDDRNKCEARIAELEAKLRTMSELDEQYLLLIDEQSERIAELVAKLDEEEEEQPIDYMYYDAVDEYRRSQK